MKKSPGDQNAMVSHIGWASPGGSTQPRGRDELIRLPGQAFFWPKNVCGKEIATNILQLDSIEIPSDFDAVL